MLIQLHMKYVIIFYIIPSELICKIKLFTNLLRVLICLFILLLFVLICGWFVGLLFFLLLLLLVVVFCLFLVDWLFFGISYPLPSHITLWLFVLSHNILVKKIIMGQTPKSFIPAFVDDRFG